VPAQTIKFITDQTPNITYLKSDQLNQITDDCCLKSATAILPMATDETLFAYLKDRFPNGQIEQKQDFSIFKINF